MKKLGDWAIALTVVACSIVLFLALAFALQGNPFSRPGRTLRAQFPDITGIQPSALVKFAGANAGTVHSVRILTPEERAASENPANAIELVLALNSRVPPVTRGVVASVSSDTLLADKFILLEAGDPRGPVLAEGALVPTLTPVTFDALLRDINGTLASLRKVVGGGEGDALGDLVTKVDQLLARLDATVTQAQGLIGNGDKLVTNAGGLVKNGDALVADAGEFLDATKPPVERLLGQLSRAADALESLSRRGDRLLAKNEDNLNATAEDARVAVSELKAAAISTRALMESLRARPQQLIWGPGRSRNAPATPGSN